MWILIFYFYQLLLSPPWGKKKKYFLSLKKHILETQMVWNQKFTANPSGEDLKQPPLQTTHLNLNSLPQFILAPTKFVSGMS